MKPEKEYDNSISFTFSGVASGNIAVGKEISQVQLVGDSYEVKEEDRAAVRQLISLVKTQVEAMAPPAQKAAALERIEELEEAIISEKPDLTTIEYVRRWFSKHLPKLTGSVVSVLISPIVGKVVEATGEIAAGELKRRFSS